MNNMGLKREPPSAEILVTNDTRIKSTTSNDDTSINSHKRERNDEDVSKEDIKLGLYPNRTITPCTDRTIELFEKDDDFKFLRTVLPFKLEFPKSHLKEVFTTSERESMLIHNSVVRTIDHNDANRQILDKPSNFSTAQLAYMMGEIRLEPTTTENIHDLRAINLETIPIKYNDFFYHDILHVNPRGLSLIAYWKRPIRPQGGKKNFVQKAKDLLINLTSSSSEQDLTGSADDDDNDGNEDEDKNTKIGYECVPAGAIACRLDSRCAYVMTLGVLPEFRNQKLASLLVKETHKILNNLSNKMLKSFRVLASETVCNTSLDGDTNQLLYNDIVVEENELPVNDFSTRGGEPITQQADILKTIESSLDHRISSPSHVITKSVHAYRSHADPYPIKGLNFTKQFLNGYVLGLPPCKNDCCWKCEPDEFPLRVLQLTYASLRNNTILPGTKFTHYNIDCESILGMYLHVHVKNIKALKFYIRNGFKIITKINDYYIGNQGILPPDAYLLGLDV